MDIDEALLEVRDAVDVWLQARKHPDESPFSGGSLDSWPAWASDALAIARDEERAVWDFVNAERKGATRG